MCLNSCPADTVIVDLTQFARTDLGRITTNAAYLLGHFDQKTERRSSYMLKDKRDLIEDFIANMSVGNDARESWTSWAS